MEQLSGFPYFPVEFTKDAAVHDQADVTALQEFVQRDGTTDLIVFSHGWNNNMEEAKALYVTFLGNFRSVVDAGTLPNLADRKWAVLGLLWPSKKFEEKELIPSGAAGAGSVVGMAAMKAKLEGLKGLFDAPQADRTLDELQRLLPKLEDSTSAQKEFVEQSPLAGPQAHPGTGRRIGGIFQGAFGRVAGEVAQTDFLHGSSSAREYGWSGRNRCWRRRRLRRIFQRHLVRRAECAQLHHLLSDEGAGGVGRGQRSQSDPP
ncbi:MAG: hypothetical protein QM771_17410 [Nitrospira sp.]